MPTAIEWVRSADGSQGLSWNPVVGCSKVSPGCANCYAETQARRFHGQHGYPDPWKPWTPANEAHNVRLRPDKLDVPLRRRKPTTWFVNSMSDLFHEQVPEHFIQDVFEIMARCPQHTFQILTKRPERAREILTPKEGEHPSFLELVSRLARRGVEVCTAADARAWWRARLDAAIVEVEALASDLTWGAR